MLLNFQSSANIAPPAGSIISVLVGANDPPTLAVADLAPSTTVSTTV